MPTKIFGSLRPKSFAGKTWYPLLYMKHFDTPNFLKHWTDAHKNFRRKETKNFRRKNVLLLLCIKFFHTLILLEHWRNVHKTFRQCETKIFRRKFVIPPIIHKMFKYLKLSETLKVCPKKFFGTMRSKIFAEKTWCPLLYKKLFNTPTFLNYWTAAHKKFQHCETKSFQLKNAISLTMHNFFLYPQNIWIIEGMPTKFFGPLRPKLFAGKTWYPLLNMKLSIPQLFWNIERKPTKNFGTVRQKVFNWKMRYPLLCIIFFFTPKISESLKGCPRNSSARWDRNFSQEKRDIPYYTWNISIPQLFWNIEQMPTKIFGARRPKFFAEKTCYFYYV